MQHSTEEHERAGLAEPSDSFDPRYVFTYHRSEVLLLQGRALEPESEFGGTNDRMFTGALCML